MTRQKVRDQKYSCDTNDHYKNFEVEKTKHLLTQIPKKDFR